MYQSFLIKRQLGQIYFLEAVIERENQGAVNKIHHDVGVAFLFLEIVVFFKLFLGFRKLVVGWLNWDRFVAVRVYLLA